MRPAAASVKYSSNLNAWFSNFYSNFKFDKQEVARQLCARRLPVLADQVSAASSGRLKNSCNEAAEMVRQGEAALGLIRRELAISESHVAVKVRRWGTGHR